MSDTLYRAVEIPSDEPLAYVGVHPIRWHKHPDQPQVGFVPVEEEEPSPRENHTGVTWTAPGDVDHELPSDVIVQFEIGGGDTLEVSFSDTGAIVVESLDGKSLEIQVASGHCVRIDT